MEAHQKTSEGPSTNSIAEVLVAMSGDVDSTVAALLLAQEGYKVAGITMHLFDNDLIGEEMVSTCCSLDDVEDARCACRKLGVDHFTLNFKNRFSEEVVDLHDVNVISGNYENATHQVEVKTTYRQKPVPGTINLAEGPVVILKPLGYIAMDASCIDGFCH